MKTRFVSIGANSFRWNGKNLRELRLNILREQNARKRWLRSNGRRYLACHSSDGVRSRDGEYCGSCPHRKDCQLKLRLYFQQNDIDGCMELPASSMENFKDYSDGLRGSMMDIHQIVTIARVVDRGYWGEVTFVPET